jgi:cytochrome c peroxidase
MNRYFSILSALGLILLIYACKKQSQLVVSDEVSLGEKLFFDKLLSRDSSISCASCHKPEFAFADTVALSLGVRKQLTIRNTPGIMNLLGHGPFFWDGRAETLEEQALGPIESRGEMDLPISEVVNRLSRNDFYRQSFYKVYGENVSKDLMVKAIVAYENTLETSKTPFDKYMQGDTNAISAAAKRGQLIFNMKGKCFDCHFGPDFSNDDFKSIGLFDGKAWNDSGQFLITRRSDDLGKFKTPGLRNVAITAPYMHNGKFATLESVIDYYNEPSAVVPFHQNRDTIFNKPLGLSKGEKSDLLAFLKTLTDTRFDLKR